MRCGNHPSQILERVQNELDKNKIVGEITFMDYGIQDTRVQVHVNDSYYGTFNYIDNIFEDTPDCRLTETIESLGFGLDMK